MLTNGLPNHIEHSNCEPTKAATAAAAATVTKIVKPSASSAVGPTR